MKCEDDRWENATEKLSVLRADCLLILIRNDLKEFVSFPLPFLREKVSDSALARFSFARTA
jgi:hypothetical protein